jgi:hypothetical protein
MRVVLSKAAVLLHVTLLVVLLGSGYCRAFALSTYLPLIWLVLGVFEAVCLFPPALKGERIEQSRWRVRRRLLHDPVFYLGLAGLLFLACQAINGPCGLVYSRAARGWLIQPPPFPLLPFCLDRAEACEGVFWFAPAWAAALAVRHGLTRRGKVRALNMLALASLVLAMFSLVHYAGGRPLRLWWAPDATGYGAFADAGSGGIYFGLSFFVSGGLLLHAWGGDSPGTVRRRLYLAAALANLLAATFSLDDTVLLLVWGGGALWGLYACVYLVHSLRGATRLRLAAGVLLIAGAIAFLHLVAYPDNAVHERARALASGEGMLGEQASTDRQVLQRGAWRAFLAHPAYGTGTWSFGRVVGRHVEDDEWLRVSPANQQPTTCSNDPLQFLCEVGIVGGGVLLAILVILWAPVIRRLHLLFRLAPGQADAIDPVRVRRISPLAVSCLFGVVGVALVSFADDPFRNPLVLLVWAMLLAILPALLPVPKLTVEAPAKDTMRRTGRRPFWRHFGRSRQARRAHQ